MAAKDPDGTRPRTDRRWHAVSVKPGQAICESAAAAKNRRWLSREAPVLPLPGCTMPDHCRCTYQHHEDRRVGGRRAEDMDAFARPVKVVNERRKQRSRRAPRED